jgi:hypothetical protein
MNNSTNRAMGRISKETYAEKKARIHSAFQKSRDDYEVRKKQEATARKEQSLVKTTTFKMSATTQTQLKEVSKSLGITPSEFIRDAVVEGLNVLHLDKQSNE